MIWKFILISVFSVSVFGAPPLNPSVTKDYLMCELCHVIVKDLQVLIDENATQTRVEGYLTDICNRLTANQESCLGFVQKSMPEVFQKLHNGLDPENICIQLHVCPSNEKDAITDVLPLPVGNIILKDSSNPLECDLCKFILDYLDKKLVNNRSEDAINATLTQLCNALPSQLSVLCNKLKPDLLKALEDEVLPEKVCKTVRACSAAYAKPGKNAAVSCLMCENVLESIAGEVGVQICAEIAGVCGKVKSHSQVNNYETNQIEPQEEYQMPTGPAECTLCKFVVMELDNLVGSNKTDAKLNETIHKICNSLPGELQGLCETFAPILIIAIENGLDPNTACSKIKLCPGELHDEYQEIEEEKKEEFTEYDLVEEVMKDAEKEERDRLKDFPSCVVCKFLIQEIGAFINQQKPASEIHATMNSLCDKYASSMTSLCKTYVPIIIRSIEEGFEPSEACEKIKLCPNGTLTKDLEPVPVEEEKEEVKAGPGCTLCKFLVQEIDAYIGQNKTAEQINATVYGLCAKLPAQLASLCKAYAPIIIKDVMAGFDPEQTCEKVKLCTNSGDSSVSLDEELDSLIKDVEENDKAGPGCTLCKFLVQEIDTYIGQNKTAEQINATVYALCKKLPAPLGSLCTAYAPVIIKDVMAGFDPEQTCEKVKLCTNSRSLLSKEQNMMKQLEGKASPGCLLCKLLVQEIDTYIGQNKTAEQINATVYALCKKLPAPLGSLCTTYAPIIIKDVMAGFDPEQTCEKVKLCTNSSALFSKELNPHDIVKQLEVKASPAGCTLCKFLVQEIDVYIGQNKTVEQINATVYALCKKLPAPLSSLCTTYAPIIIKDVMAGLNPEQTCEKVKLCSNSSSLLFKELNPHDIMEQLERMASPAGCTLCKFLVQEIDVYIGQNKTAEQINATVYALCKKLPAPLGSLCTTYAPIIIKDVMAGLNPEQTCEKIKLCTNSSSLLSKELNPHDITKQLEGMASPAGCTLCKFLVQEIDVDIGQNKTAEQINATVYALCKKLPAPLSSLCTTYAPIIIKDVMAGLNPEQTCEKVKLCTKNQIGVRVDSIFVSSNSSITLYHSSSLLPKELNPHDITEKLERMASPAGCTLCKFLVQEIDVYIGQNKTAEQINATVYALCKKLPAPLSSLCTTYAPIIIKDVMAGLNPEQTCEKIKLCTNRSSLFSTDLNPHDVMKQLEVKASPGCLLCKLLVQEIDAYIGQNKTAEQINATVYALCKKLPAPLGSLCTTYAPIIIKDVMAGFDPEQTCEKVKLCTNSSSSLAKMLKSYSLKKEIDVKVEASPGCTICKFLVQEVDYYVSLNYSEAQLNSTLYGLCAKLPVPLASICKAYAPIILKDVMAGFDPEKTCEKIKLCTTSPGCTLCKFLVEEIDHYMAMNQSAAQINATVYSLCAKLTAPLAVLCLEYAPIIIKDAMAGLDPEQTCEKVKLCTTSSLPLAEEFKLHSFKEELTKKIEAGPGCTLCKFLVQEIDTYIGQNKTAEQINATVYALCKKLPAPLGSLCEAYAPVIIKDVMAGFDPEQTCEKVKLCTKNSLSLDEAAKLHYLIEKELEENIKASPGCTLCKFLVQEIDHYVAMNQSAAQINATVFALCSKLPAPLASLCKAYAPIIIKDVMAGFDPEQTCEKVKLCTKGVLPLTEEFEPKVKEEIKEKIQDGPGCVICKLIVQEIDTLIAENKSAAEINATVFNLCGKLPATIKSLCYAYAPMIVKDVLSGLNPQQTCVKVKLCTNGTYIEPLIKEIAAEEKSSENNSKMTVTVDPLCGLCEFVVQLVDQYIAENKSIAVINASVMGICKLLPANLRNPCILFAPQIVNIIDSGVDPQAACKAIKMCLNNGGQKELTGLSCGQCHGIVETFLPKKYTPKFGNLMCMAACPVARRRRAIDKDLNLDFVSRANPKGSWRCDLCEFIIEAINTYFKNNVTDRTLEQYMDDICKFMPQPFKDQCLKSVPEILQELEHGFDQNVLCQHYLPDECKNDTETFFKKEMLEKIFQAKQKDKDSRCEMCKDIIKFIDGSLNHDKNEVKSYVDDVCSRLPSPTNKACKSFAGAELEDILMRIIDKLLTPEEVCHMVHVC